LVGHGPEERLEEAHQGPKSASPRIFKPIMKFSRPYLLVIFALWILSTSLLEPGHGRVYAHGYVVDLIGSKDKRLMKWRGFSVLLILVVTGLIAGAFIWPASGGGRSRIPKQEKTHDGRRLIT